MKRMSIVIRDIWVEVEATVKDYQKETVQTRSENARLKQQLSDALSRNRAHLNGKHTLKRSLGYLGQLKVDCIFCKLQLISRNEGRRSVYAILSTKFLSRITGLVLSRRIQRLQYQNFNIAS